jgi:hypothetical protein
MKNHIPLPKVDVLEPEKYTAAMYNAGRLPPAGKYVALCTQHQVRRWDPKKMVDCATCCSVLKNGEIQFRNILHTLGVRTL